MTDRWTDALQDVAARLNGAQIDWTLVGSAATAIRGAAIEPGDIDIALPTSSAVHDAARQLPNRPDASPPDDFATWYSSAAQPVLSFTDHADSRWTFGRWTLSGIKVELAHIDRPGTADLFIETFGQAVWAARTIVEFDGVQITVVPLETQLVTMMLRDQQERLEAILSAVGPEGVDVAMLRRAIDDRRTEGAQLDVPRIIRRVLSARSQ